MDALAKSDIELSRQTSPAERLKQALDLMETGLRLKRVALALKHPGATPAEIDEAFQRWLFDDA